MSDPIQTLEGLREFGVVVEVEPRDPTRPALPDLIVTLRRGDSRQTYAVDTKSPQHGDMGESPDQRLPILVVTDHLVERVAQPLRDEGLQYVDALGNAYITFAEVLIDVRGRRAGNRSPKQSEQRTINLFSPRRAQVACALLAWPDLRRRKLLELAAASGVSISQAHGTRDLLERYGLLPESASDIDRRQRLCAAWAAAYPTGLGPSLAIQAFHGETNDLQKVRTEDLVFISGESAVSEALRPTTLTIYVTDLDPKLPVLNRWRSDQRPNVYVRRKFWGYPTEHLIGLPHAPWPLIYGDLLASGDSRQREVAEEWVMRHVGPAGF